VPRHLTELNKKQFENLCGLQCTKAEICAFFEITDKTLERWCKRTYKKGFSDIFREKRGIGKISLRRSQWRLAEKNAAMAIWLGKQYLGQKEQPEISLTVDNRREDALSASLRELADSLERENKDDRG